MNHSMWLRFLKSSAKGSIVPKRFLFLGELNSINSKSLKYSMLQHSSWKHTSSCKSHNFLTSQTVKKTFRSFFSSEVHDFPEFGAENSANDTQEFESVENEFRKEVLSLDEIYEHIIDENGRDVLVMQLPKSVNYVEFFVIATANSSRHLIHLAESLNRLYKQRKSEDDPFRMIEGKRTSKEWQCIDFGNAVVHFMLEPIREKYQLERLWLFGPEFDDLLRETPDMRKLLKQQSEKELFLLSDVPNTSEFIKDFETVNPWEIEYEADEKTMDKWDDDEDAYII